MRGCSFSAIDSALYLRVICFLGSVTIGAGKVIAGAVTMRLKLMALVPKKRRTGWVYAPVCDAEPHG